MKYFYILFLILQSMIIRGQQNIDFEFDYCQFKYDSLNNYLEIYYSLYPNQFKLTTEKDTLTIQGILNLIIVETTNKDTLVDKTWDVSKAFSDTSDYSNSSSLLGVVGYKIPRGSYNLSLILEDLVDTLRSKSYNEIIQISLFNNNKAAISDIQLASRILNDNVNKQSIFYKNTFEVYPNPSLIYSKAYPILFYYCELYFMDSASSDSLLITNLVFNSKNEKMYEKIKSVGSNNSSIVEVGIVNLSTFPTDSYRMDILLGENKDNLLSSSSKRFFLVNPNVKKTQLVANKRDYMSTEFGVLSMEECDVMFDKSRIIAASGEIDQYELLDSLSEKREFLFNFWLKRDDIPSTPINEFKVNYFSRINIAYERYSTVSRPGYKTDRGRVYARFGEPDEIERHPNETDTKPYEIWFYNQIQGGVYFVFGDYTGFSDYELLHSTMRGELQDPSWMRRIRTN